MNNNTNKNEPIVLGELKKEKSSKPIFVIIVFVALIGICFGLPEIKNYFNTENNKITKIYNNTIGKILNNIIGDSEELPTTNITTKEDELGLTKLDSYTEIRFNEIILTNIILNKNKITYTVVTTNNETLDLNEKNYYLLVYGSNQNQLSRLKLTGIVTTEPNELTGTFSNLNTVSKAAYYGKIVDLTSDEYEQVQLVDNKLTCVLDNNKFIYTFNNNKLTNIEENLKYYKNENADDFTTKWNFYNLKSNTISMYPPSTSSITSDENSFTFIANLDLSTINIDDLGTYKDSNYYKYETDVKKINTEMKSKGYTCS